MSRKLPAAVRHPTMDVAVIAAEVPEVHTQVTKERRAENGKL